MIYGIEDTLKAIRSLFNNAKDLKGVIGKYIEEHDTMRKEIESFEPRPWSVPRTALWRRRAP